MSLSKAEEEAVELVLQSIVYNNDDLLRELVLENSLLIKFSDLNGWTILHHAAVKGHTSCAVVLLECGADIDALSSIKDGLKSALMLASEHGKTETAELLINYGADLFACDLNGYSALQLAQLKGQSSTADMLINSSENIHSQSIQLRTKLCAACIDNDFGVVQEVMNEAPRSAHKKILNGETEDEKSALYLACEHGRSEILPELLKFSSKHSILYISTGDTILHAAVASQDPATVQIAIEKFPYLMDVANNEGSLALHWACRCGNLEVVRILLEHIYPKSELKAVENGRGGESFYQFSCNLNAGDNECRTPLYLAVANGHTTVLEYLATFKLSLFHSMDSVQSSSSSLECPFMFNVYCNNGRTPLMIASANGNVDMVKVLLDNGADINLPVALTDVEISNLKPMEEARCAGSGALIEAAKGGHLELVAYLLKYGALDYDNKALAVVIENEKWDLVSSFLCQLTFPDPEYRIYKPTKKDLPLSNMLLNTTNLLPQVFPSTACQLNWHNTNLDRLAIDWLVNAALHLNSRVRQPRLALSAVTRLDLSNNRLALLPHTLFQLPSLRILNVDENCIKRIELPLNGEWQTLCLEICSLANNYIADLPVGFFSDKLMPQLKVLNVSGNNLHHLPPEIWTAPRLRELNCMSNKIVNITSMVLEQETRQHRQLYNGGYRRQANPRRHPRRQQSRQETELPAQDESKSREITAATITPRMGGKAWAASVTDVDVIRVNIWQKKIQLSNVEDYEHDEKESSALDPNLTKTASLGIDGQLDSVETISSSALRILNLSGNKLKQVPSCLACCAPRLTRLDLSMNEISCIGPVECLPGSLKHLNLANNQLSRCFTHHSMDSSMLCCQAPAPTDSTPEMSNPQSKSRPVIINNSYSVNRHSRSRSKSVARNQRSLSIIRAAEDRSGDAGSSELEPCVHRSHCRLETLKSLNLSHNRLQSVDLMVAFGGVGSGSLEHFNWKENGQQMKSYMLFPALTTLDLSHNQLKCVPATISLLSYLAVLNLASNHELDNLPPELGLLDKLWNVVLKDCSLKKEQEPLRSMANDNYKTSEVLLHLRNKLENSKLYPKMKLMLVGASEVGKSTLLQSLIRQEGQVSKKALQSESWARRMGHSPAKGFSPSSNAKSFSSSTSANNHLLSAIRKGFPVDVVEWCFEPKKSSKSGFASAEVAGPVTFRTWDFTGLQKEFSVIQQYFFTRRCLFLVVWKVTEGEITLNEIHDWLLAIQTRAPNSTVLIIGTHADYVKDNHDQRFPREYLEELHSTIQDRFVNVSDAEKKGLPKVIASIYVSSSSKEDIKSLCNLLYQVAAEIRSIGSGSSRRSKMLSQKVPAAFVALEKIVVSVTDELRTKGEEPILRFDDFWVLATTQMIEEYGKPFRDILEFRQACNFLHENGIIVHFDDTALREFVFIDPPWLCALLRAAVSGGSQQLSSNHSSTYQHSIVEKQSLYSSLKFALRNFGQMTTHLSAGRTNSTGVALVKFRLFRACLLNLLAKFELALPCLNKMVLLASLLPDEYLLRADYPGARVNIHSKVDKWQLRAGPNFQPHSLYVDATSSIAATSNSTVSPIRQYLTHKRLARTLALLTPSESRHSIDSEKVGGGEGNTASSLLHDARVRRKSSVASSCLTSLSPVPSPPPLSPKIHFDTSKENTVRRLYVMQYIPPGFWPRLTTRLLDDDKLGGTFSKLFVVNSYSPTTTDQLHPMAGESTPLLTSLSQALNNYTVDTGVEVEKETSFITTAKRSSPTCCEKGEVCASEHHFLPYNPLTGGFQWLLWKTGVEIRAFNNYLFSLKQFLPLANVLDVNYSMVEMEKKCEDGVWRTLALESNMFLLELLIPAGCKIRMEWNGGVYSLEIDQAVATKFLSIVVNIIDDLLEDWFPALGTRFVHSSDGSLLVNRLIPCYHCAQQTIDQMESGRVKSRDQVVQKLREETKKEELSPADPYNTIYLFSVEECILEAKNSSALLASCRTWPPEAKFLPEKSKPESGSSELICPKHSHLSLHLMAPDVAFADLSSTDLVVQPHNIRRGKLVGRGAFGFVFNGFVKQKNEIFTEVALKVLEPIDAASTSINSNAGGGSARAAFEAFSLKWNNDALGGQLENCARSYCTARQELNMLSDIRHSHVTSLIGFSVQPMTLVVEWAPQGALNEMLVKYRRCNTKLSPNTLQKTCVQIAKALEYLHGTNHIIYRDLKSENVLVWRFPLPYSSGSMDVHLKLGDYGISRYSYPSGICKGYGGTEGFMAPEVMRYNGEEEYTEKVDCFSFGMFLYELVSLKQPYEGHEQMKEFLLEGRRPFVSEKELLLPSNLLDLMVICWSESAEFRPSSSQLVGICSAPEFTHLMDVAVLKDGEHPDLAIVINCCRQQDDLNEIEQCNQSCWITRSTKNSISSLSCSQFGWTDRKIIELSESVANNHQTISSMCQVEQNIIWIGDSGGKITVCNCSSLIEIFTFSVFDLKWDAQTIKLKENSSSNNVPKSWAVEHILAFEERQMVVIGLRNFLLICKNLTYENGCEVNETPRLLARIELKSGEEIFKVALLPSLTDWQIWTAHSNEKIFIHHISCNTNKLIFSTSISHSTSFIVEPKNTYIGPHGEQLAGPKDAKCLKTKTSKNVKLLIASRTTSNTVWSVLENDSRLFMWRHSSLRKTLDCCKILPTSESLSSMNIEVSRNSYVTCISLIHSLVQADSTPNNVYLNKEQLLVGTNRGVVIIVQALEMLPLTSFRPFNAEIEHILACEPQKSRRRLSKDVIHSQLRPSTTLANLNQPVHKIHTVSQPSLENERKEGSFASRRLSRFRGKSRTNSTDLDTSPLDNLSARGSEIYEAMSKGVKEILSGIPISSSEYGIANSIGNGLAEVTGEETGYFITIGREYRCLLNRFTNISETPESTSIERCAIFWRSDVSCGWTIDHQ